jgi:hypothetical protein
LFYVEYDVNVFGKCSSVVVGWTLILLAGCANLNSVIKESAVLQAPTSHVEKINIIAVTPQIAPGSSPSLIQGYQMSAVADSFKMERAMARAAELFSLNGVPAKYIGSFGRGGVDFAGLIKANAGGTAHTLFFEPVGSSITSQNGAPIHGHTRYRISLLKPDGQRVLEMYDDFSANIWIGAAVDSRSGPWFSTLGKYNFVKLPIGGNLQAPPHRDFVREDREKQGLK